MVHRIGVAAVGNHLATADHPSCGTAHARPCFGTVDADRSANRLEDLLAEMVLDGANQVCSCQGCGATAPYPACTSIWPRHRYPQRNLLPLQRLRRLGVVDHVHPLRVGRQIHS